MSKQIRVRSVRKPEVDTDQLAVAFLMLAKILHEQEQATSGDADEGEPGDACASRARGSS